MAKTIVETEHQKEFFRRFAENINLKGQKESFAQILDEPIWWLAEEKGGAPDFKKPDLSACKAKCEGVLSDNFCKKNLSKIISDVRRTYAAQEFVCPGKLHGVCFPLAVGEKIYGYFFFCHLRKKMTAEIQRIFHAFLETIVKEVQKELELSKLYETIRPRAIALSTIHTIHRLISSLLKLDELLPRIARLSLQVLRANKCSIFMLNEDKKYMTSRSIIDLRKNCARSKRIKLGQGLEGKVAKTGNAVIKKNLLSVPLVHEEILGVITIQDRLDRKPFDVFDKEILSTLAEQAVIAINNAQLYEEQERITIGSIKSLAMILDTKSPYTYTHSSAFVKLVLALAQQVGMPQDEIKYLHYAALLPDAGKIWVPEKILRKPSGLTGQEYKMIKEHPIKGVEILRHIEVLKPAIPIILHHHERYDGAGYPTGLKKDEIPLGARIMAVADALEAMVFKRPYRAALPISTAIAEIKRHSGTQFDPAIVEAFLKLVKSSQFNSILKEE